MRVLEAAKVYEANWSETLLCVLDRRYRNVTAEDSSDDSNRTKSKRPALCVGTTHADAA